jgi:hypothetical protein
MVTPGGQGLGLLSGSRLSDIITTLAEDLAVFGTRYEEKRWRTFLLVVQTAIPGCTELEAQWLISHPAPIDSPLPAPGPRSQHKRKASRLSIGGSEIRNTT